MRALLALALIYTTIIPVVFIIFLNQVRASQRPACTWFLEIAFVCQVDVCVCVSAPEAINNYSREMNP